ncbi:MAG: HAD-IA family hydrolase [Clostridia bacterium]
MKKNKIFFDLDGTLVDSGEGVLNGVEYALSKYGILVSDRQKLFGFMGPPLNDSFMKYYGFSLDKANEAVNFYREFYSKKGVYQFTVYKDIPKLLQYLKNCGCNIYIATSKPVFYAKMVMKKANLFDFFDDIYGSEFDGTRATKIDVMKYAIAQSNTKDYNSAVMIGDREYDVNGAHAVGIECIAILFGYGTKKEFIDCKADYICETVVDVIKLLASEE